MSFSSDVKNELSKINNLKNKDEVYAELLGYLCTNNISVEKNSIKFSTENEYNINRFSRLLSNLNIIDFNINISGKTFNIVFYDKEINEKNKLGNIKEILKLENLEKAFIRGNFLGAGSINNPQNTYHLEIIFNKEEYALFSIEILKKYGIIAKILDKTLYIKDGQDISDFLALVGASSSVLKFEDVRVYREMKNNVNRIVNCETANLNKTINASVKQLDIIKKLKKNGNFNNLPEELKEIAILREENPDVTLEQLGKMLENPIGKSSVSHRFKRLEDYL